MRWQIIAPALALVLGACSAAGGFVGSKHGYCGSLSIKNTKMVGCPTIDENGDPMGSRVRQPDGTVLSEDMYSTYTDGNVSATGPAALMMAEAKMLEKKALLCAISPEACGADPPTEMLIALE